MFRQDADNQAPVTGSEREQNPFLPSPLLETDATTHTPLMKTLLNKDLIGFMSRFFVSRYPS
jgi:hypothetical protein